VLLIRERLVEAYQDRPGWEWIRPGWFRFVLLGWIYFLALGHILPTYDLFFDSRDAGLFDMPLMFLEMGLIAAAVWYFTTRSKDLWSLSLTLLAVDISLIFFLIRPFFEEAGDLTFFLFAGFVITLAVFWGSFVFLTRVRRRRRVTPASPERGDE
jgi:hypothetical protein